jgi:eukaryotic-like serine/threonine-protein kinase
VTAEVVAGRYRLGERLGIGGMSEVWSAEDLELERTVALKLVAPDADRARFEREAQAVARLSHPHIGRLFDFGEAAGRPYMVLELLSEGLDGRLRAGEPLPDEETRRIAAELASALAYAHAEGVLHRDVKPSNVLFDADGSVKLVDFGIARMLGEPTLTEAGTVLGTAAYISPEQARGEPVTAATDVYAFGAVLFQMLTGRPPFEGADALEVATRHATEEPPPISSLRADAPPDLAEVAMLSLAKRPEERPPDGDALLALLTGGAQTVVEDATQVLAPPPPRSRRLGPRELLIAGALLALAVIGAGAAVLATPESSQAPVTGTTNSPTTARVTTAPTTTPTTAESTTESTTTAQTTVPSPPPTTTARTSTQAPTTAQTTTATQPTTTEVTTTATTETTETATTTTPEG